MNNITNIINISQNFSLYNPNQYFKSDIDVINSVCSNYHISLFLLSFIIILLILSLDLFEKPFFRNRFNKLFFVKLKDYFIYIKDILVFVFLFIYFILNSVIFLDIADKEIFIKKIVLIIIFFFIIMTALFNYENFKKIIKKYKKF